MIRHEVKISFTISFTTCFPIFFFDPLFEKGPFPFGKWDEKWPLPVTFPVKPGRPGPRPAVEAIGPSPAGHSRRARPSRSPGDVRGEQQVFNSVIDDRF